MVTVIDALTLTDRFKSTKTASRKGFIETENPRRKHPKKEWMKELPPKFLEAW
jgi:hypothetical protein